MLPPALFCSQVFTAGGQWHSELGQIICQLGPCPIRPDASMVVTGDLKAKLASLQTGIQLRPELCTLGDLPTHAQEEGTRTKESIPTLGPLLQPIFWDLPIG